MNYYKRIIKSGDMTEVEIYQSIKQRDLKGLNRTKGKLSKTSEKQKARNDIKAKKQCQRLIANNFQKNDFYLTLKFRDDVDEAKADRLINNFLRRLRSLRKRLGLPELKYIGCIECGKRGKRWHGHMIVQKMDFNLIAGLWPHGRIWCEKLYTDGMWADLAQYIRKDVLGKKRLKQSRNLVPPKVTYKELSRKDFRAVESGLVIDTPKGYKLVDYDYSVFTSDRFAVDIGKAYFMFERVIW